MKRIGITGQNGFVGSHLFNTLKLAPTEFTTIDFQNIYFDHELFLDEFVSKCDVIIHLAGMNRHENPEIVYQTNIRLAEKLRDSLIRNKKTPHIIFSSSTQEVRDNLYGKSKKAARTILNDWAKDYGGTFTGLIIPNVYGPFGKPFYNSVISTFCYQLCKNEMPEIKTDIELNLIYVNELVTCILEIIKKNVNTSEYVVSHTASIRVSEVLSLLKNFKQLYLSNSSIPKFNSQFELNLFNTFRSFIDLKSFFPVFYKQHFDTRGSFTELIRLHSGGQISFSTTVPGITRGNHFHTRKIERFSVIKGNALIQLRKIDDTEILEFYLDGNKPGFVDMPVWYTHNIKNIGDDELLTVFWINEFYDNNDPDTFLETV